ncbi:MAG: Fic family protein [Candidatus Enteromonas sp.]
MAKQIAPYQAAVTINNEILSSACNIAFEAGRLSLSPAFRMDPETLYQEVKASFLLEGVAFTPSQARALKRGEDIQGLPEASALMRLYARMSRVNPYDIGFVDEFAAAIFPDGVPFRMSRRVESFPYPIPLHAKILPMLKGFYSFAKSGKERHPILLSALFYFEIMAIQPFSKYTKTLALYLMKAVLVSYAAEFANVPLISLFAQKAEELDEAYRRSVETADTAPFVLAALRLVERAILSAQRKGMRRKNEGTPLARKLVSKMEDGRFYSAVELLGILGLTSRLGLSKNYLHPALEAGLIEMANPLTPTDRNQRYRKVSHEN